MSHSPTSYIDGVPVKISERYKPPPKISLPQKLAQLLSDNAAQRVDAVDSADVYDFSTEHAHRQLVSEWQAQRHHEHCARRQRLHRRHLDRQREQDEREKRKLTAVSYPSDDEEVDESTNANDAGTETASLTAMPEALDAPTADTTPQEQPVVHQQKQQQQRFDTILMPTIMPTTTNNWTFATSTKATTRVLNGVNGGKINWSDFENDTSSPFDTIELTAINDLDMLAQVLHLNAMPSSPSPPPPPPPSTTTATCDNVQPHSESDDTDATPPPISTATTTAATTATTTTNYNSTLATTTATNSILVQQQTPSTGQQPINIDNIRNMNAMGTTSMTGSPLNSYMMGSPTTGYYNGYQMPLSTLPPQQQQQQNYVNYNQQQQQTVYQMQPVTVHHHSNYQHQQMPDQNRIRYNGAVTSAYNMNFHNNGYGNSYTAPTSTAAVTPMMPFNGDGGGLVVGAFKATSVPDILSHTAKQQHRVSGEASGAATPARSARY